MSKINSKQTLTAAEMKGECPQLTASQIFALLKAIEGEDKYICLSDFGITNTDLVFGLLKLAYARLDRSKCSMLDQYIFNAICLHFIPIPTHVVFYPDKIILFLLDFFHKNSDITSRLTQLFLWASHPDLEKNEVKYYWQTAQECSGC